jgi:hypothetical protein
MRKHNISDWAEPGGPTHLNRPNRQPTLARGSPSDPGHQWPWPPRQARRRRVAMLCTPGKPASHAPIKVGPWRTLARPCFSSPSPLRTAAIAAWRCRWWTPPTPSPGASGHRQEIRDAELRPGDPVPLPEIHWIAVVAGRSSRRPPCFATEFRPSSSSSTAGKRLHKIRITSSLCPAPQPSS